MAEKKISTEDDDIEDDKNLDDDDDGEDGKKTIKKNDDDAGEDDDDAEDSDEDVDDDKVVPPVRKHVTQHIITRQKKTIDKLRSKQQDDDDSDDDDDNSDIDEDLDDDKRASKVIGQEVQKHLKPVMKVLASEADENELKDLFANEPGSKKYEKRIKAYMQNEHYQGVPPSVIYHHLAFGKASGEIGNKKKAADLEANQSRNAGSGRRPTKPKGEIPSVEDMEDMDDKQFERLQHQNRIGKFAKKEE